MDIELLTGRYAARIAGVLSCWDRVLVFGTLANICYAGGMTSYLHERKVRIFDYPRFAGPFREGLRESAERLAAEAGIEIEFVRNRNFRKEDCSYPGFNFFAAGDDELFRAVARGEFNVSGMQNKTLRRCLSGNNSAQISRLLKRLRLHGLIRKAGRTCKYYVTQFGKQVIPTRLKLRELVIIPQLAFGQTA